MTSHIICNPLKANIKPTRAATAMIALVVPVRALLMPTVASSSTKKVPTDDFLEATSPICNAKECVATERTSKKKNGFANSFLKITPLAHILYCI